MSANWTKDVYDFHKRFGQRIGDIAGIPVEVRSFRLKLILEEFSELIEAWAVDDLVEVADASIDLIYVLIGGLIAHGVDPQRVWDEVQRTNMTKEGGPTRADGKILKPLGWAPPDIAKAIIESDLRETYEDKP